MRPTWDSRGAHRPLFGLCPHGTTVSFLTRNLSITASQYDLDWISFLFCSQPSLIAPLDAVIFPHGQRSFLRSSPRPARLLVPDIFTTSCEDKHLLQKAIIDLSGLQMSMTSQFVGSSQAQFCESHLGSPLPSNHLEHPDSKTGKWPPICKAKGVSANNRGSSSRTAQLLRLRGSSGCLVSSNL